MNRKLNIKQQVPFIVCRTADPSGALERVKREAGANPARSRHCDKGACRQGAFAPVTEHCLGRRRQALSFQPGNLPAVGTGALLQITRNWLYLKSSWKIRGSFCVAVLHTKRPSFFYGSFVCKAAAPGFCFLYLFFSKWIYHRRKEAKHMKHNNLKKPAAVLTALALAAALLAGCGAPSDSMAASSAPRRKRGCKHRSTR